MTIRRIFSRGFSKKRLNRFFLLRMIAVLFGILLGVVSTGIMIENTPINPKQTVNMPQNVSDFLKSAEGKSEMVRNIVKTISPKRFDEIKRTPKALVFPDNFQKGILNAFAEVKKAEINEKK